MVSFTCTMCVLEVFFPKALADSEVTVIEEGGRYWLSFSVWVDKMLEEQLQGFGFLNNDNEKRR